MCQNLHPEILTSFVYVCGRTKLLNGLPAIGMYIRPKVSLNLAVLEGGPKEALDFKFTNTAGIYDVEIMGYALTTKISAIDTYSLLPRNSAPQKLDCVPPSLAGQTAGQLV